MLFYLGYVARVSVTYYEHRVYISMEKMFPKFEWICGKFKKCMGCPKRHLEIFSQWLKNKSKCHSNANWGTEYHLFPNFAI